MRWESTKYIVKDENGNELDTFKNFLDALNYRNELEIKNVKSTIEVDAVVF